MNDRSMNDPRTLRGRIIVGAVIAFGIAACGTPSASPTATPSATSAGVDAPSPARTLESPSTPAPSPTTAASTTSDTFTSTRYRYTLTLPAGSLLLGWHSADRAWDGQAKVDMAGPYPDRTGVAEGSLYLIGSEADGLEEFLDRFEGNGTRFHGCGPAQNRRDLMIGGVPAIGFTQACATGATFGRVALFKDGFGIGAWIASAPGAEMAALDKLVELLEGLEWQTG